jgi:hypothetical protein
METPVFKNSLNQCIALAQKERVVLMCAEAVPWRCHRSLIADALLAKGVDVREISSARRAQPYTLRPWTRIHENGVTYPASAFGSSESRKLSSDSLEKEER